MTDRPARLSPATPAPGPGVSSSPEDRARAGPGPAAAAIRRQAIHPHAFPARLAAIRRALDSEGIDALLVTHVPNLRYLAGFDGSLGALLVTEASVALVVDGRYITSARDRMEQTDGLQEVQVVRAEGSLEEAAVTLVMQLPGISRLGVEAAAMTLSRFQSLAGALQRAAGGADAPELWPTEGLVEQHRLVKDGGEIALLREAGARLSAVARQVLPRVSAGRSEQELAAEIDTAIRLAGFERPAFDTIVASGPNAAFPHARPTGRILQPGDGLVLDFGGVYDGYCVDLTRTVQLPPQSDAFLRLFEAVRAAQAAAIRAVAPGVETGDVDRAAREELERRGLGGAFVHGTGHGIGLELHEAPRLAKHGAPQAGQILRPGMVFTIEPGAYVPGLGGVRIEDDVLVVDAGWELLTDVPIDPGGTRS